MVGLFLSKMLGATPLMELIIAARKAVRELQGAHGLAVDRVYTGSFMTSLDMAGFSVTLMKSEVALLNRLDAPTKAPCWPVETQGIKCKSPTGPTGTLEMLNLRNVQKKAPVGGRPPLKVPLLLSPSSSSRNIKLSTFGCISEAAIEAAAKEIIRMKWDTKVGDGDCGTTRGATAIIEDMKNRYPLNDAAETLNELGATIRRVMGGTTGILYAILCSAAHTSLRGRSQPISREWAKALAASIDAVSKYGGARAGHRTMLDALVPASNTLNERLNAGDDDPMDAFVKSAEAALIGAEATKNLLAQAGRSSYISPDLLVSVPYPGATVAASWYKAAALSVSSKKA